MSAFNPTSELSQSFQGSGLGIHDKRVISKIINDWKLTPATFAHRISRGSWIPAPWLMYLSARIARAIAKGNGRIIVSAPPRHGKSQLASIYTPAWVLEKYPNYKTILTGYGAELTTGFSRQVRDIFVDIDNRSLLNTSIRKDSSRVEAFLTEQGGGMYAVGLGGAITGRGANVLLIDDYIKEIKEALSPAYRDYIWNWFVTTAYTRLEPGGTCIIIATRWHSDDLIGRILAQEGDRWEYIELPAVIETEEQAAKDLLGRQLGDVLFQERYPIERLQELKDTLGSIFWAALFQQTPVDEAAKITDGQWLKRTPSIPEQELKYLKRARVWDLAATEGGGDYTVGTLCSYNPQNGHFYIENVIRKQLSPGDVETKVREIALEDGEDVKIYIEQEPGSSGKALVEHYNVNILPEFVVEGVPVVNNKLVRAQPYIAHAEVGKVYLLEGSWNDQYIREFDTFPTGDFDDQVDTTSAGFQKLSGKRIFTASWGRNTKNSSTANSNQTKAEMTKASLRSRQGKDRGQTGRAFVRGVTFRRSA